MRADSALSHLFDDELCVATMNDGTQHEVRWNKEHWCFFYLDADMPTICPHDEIKDWHPASIRF